jgi:hypothetical protein
VVDVETRWTHEKATYRIRNQQVAGSIPAGGSTL